MDVYEEIRKLLKDLRPQWTLHIPADAADVVFGHGDEAADVMEELADECNCDIRFRQHLEGRPESEGFTFTKR